MNLRHFSVHCTFHGLKWDQKDLIIFHLPIFSWMRFFLDVLLTLFSFFPVHHYLTSTVGCSFACLSETVFSEKKGSNCILMPKGCDFHTHHRSKIFHSLVIGYLDQRNKKEIKMGTQPNGIEMNLLVTYQIVIRIRRMKKNEHGQKQIITIKEVTVLREHKRKKDRERVFKKFT